MNEKFISQLKHGHTSHADAKLIRPPAEIELQSPLFSVVFSLKRSAQSTKACHNVDLPTLSITNLGVSHLKTSISLRAIRVI